MLQQWCSLRVPLPTRFHWYQLRHFASGAINHCSLNHRWYVPLPAFLLLTVTSSSKESTFASAHHASAEQAASSRVIHTSASVETDTPAKTAKQPSYKRSPLTSSSATATGKSFLVLLHVCCCCEMRQSTFYSKHRKNKDY